MLRAIPLRTAATNDNFSVNELLFKRNGNMGSRSTGRKTAAMCGYDNRHYNYTCDYLCHVTYSVV